jgi:hypothetical protein
VLPILISVSLAPGSYLPAAKAGVAAIAASATIPAIAAIARPA